MDPQVFICIELHVCVNSREILGVAMDTQQWVHFASLLNYEVFRTIVNSMQVLYLGCYV
jgi:hypothetical protein